MGLATLPLTNFTAGEWSPRLYGRVDLAKYGNACSILENMTLMPHGAAQRRMGTEMVHGVDTDQVLLAPFVFNTEQAYVLEFSPGRIRFFRAGGIVLDGATGLPLTVVTPWSWAELQRLMWCQSADTMYLVCPTVQPHKLTRPGADVFALHEVSFTAKPDSWAGTSWPGCAMFHQQRLWFSGAPGNPQTVWASRTGDFENFTTGTNDDDALTFSLVSEQVNAIRWQLSARTLLTGTSGGEWSISGGGTDVPVTSKQVQALRNSNYGSAALPPVLIGKSVVHVSADRKRLHDLTYQFAEDGYVSADISLLAEHITARGIRQVAHATHPDGIIWCVMDDGTLAGCTYMRNNEVVGWHRHSTEGEVLSVACIPGDGYTETWLAVRRAGGVVMERMLPPWNGETTNEPGCWFVDSGLLYEGAPVTVVSGLEHLEGQRVSILADGAYHPPAVVSEGRVVLEAPASRVLVGLPYRWTLAPMSLEGSSERGTAQGKRKRVVSVTARVYKTLGLEYGLPGGTAWEAVNREVIMPMDAAPWPYTGDLELKLPEGWNRDGRLLLTGEAPFPVTLIMLVPKVVTYE
ncbi:hypothetical protein [Nitratidesulfovibrio termitidis]|uniref:hypothetical protein n=1 Tax=Nitratidesulfovibrio termitidis TaxID=42252 RepID=UPI0004033E92|nr:hypothetical protein [Nitratidesulfovibrio termitidis]